MRLEAPALTPMHEFLVKSVASILGIPAGVIKTALLTGQNSAVCSRFLQAKELIDSALIIGAQSISDRRMNCFVSNYFNA